MSRTIRVGWLAIGWLAAALGGCDETRFVGVKKQVDVFTQTGEAVVDLFTQGGVSKVDTFVQNGFHQVDAFVQRAAAKVDILWVVDNSPSMAQEQTNLGNNFTRFIAYIDQSMIDYHIGVISTDMDDPAHQGKLLGNPKVIVRGPDAANQFRQNIQVGITGGGHEMGLYAATQALSEPLLSTANAGFLRPDASLAIVFVSDENDKSMGLVGYYTRFFALLKGPGNERNVMIAALVGDAPTAQRPDGGCSGANGVAEYGERYLSLVQALGGTSDSICAADFGPTLDQLGITVAGLSHKFILSKIPDASTAKVFVKPCARAGAANVPAWCNPNAPDFVEVPQDSGVPGQPNWRLKAEEPAVYCDGDYVPPPEAEVHVEYGNVDRTFRLSARGDPTTLKVTVDDDAAGPNPAVEKQVGTDYLYDSNQNAVVFNGTYVPPLGSVIEASYSDLMRSFVLSRAVKNPETLMVEVDFKDGQGFKAVIRDDAGGWMYDSRGNAVLFQGSFVPPVGADIRVSYSNLDTFFVLTYPPDVSTIQVDLDPDGAGPQAALRVPKWDEGQGIPGWLYYPPETSPPLSNALSFEKTTVPAQGAVITVTYVPGQGT